MVLAEQGARGAIGSQPGCKCCQHDSKPILGPRLLVGRQWSQAAGEPGRQDKQGNSSLV